MSKHKFPSWIRYVDDSFVKWSQNSNMFPFFLDHLNNIHSNTIFTIETKVNNLLPMLVIPVTKINNSFAHTIDTKPTYSYRSINTIICHKSTLSRTISYIDSFFLLIVTTNHKTQRHSNRCSLIMALIIPR